MLLKRALRWIYLQLRPASPLSTRGFANYIVPFLFVAVPFSSTRAANFVVSSTEDSTSPGTLRWAIQQANSAGAGTHNITFSLPANSTIMLSSQLPALSNANATININGSGATGLVISGASPNAIFSHQSGQASITNLIISGTGGIAKSGSGTLTRSGSAGNYTGETRIDDGTINYNSGGVISPSSRTYVGDGTGAPASAVLTINSSMGTSQAIDAELATDGVVIQGNNRIVRLSRVTGTGELRLNSTVQNLFEITGAGGDSIYSGTITGGGANASLDPGAGGRFSKDGPSTLTFNGNNSYAARTFINNGVLRVESDTALGAAGVNSGTFVRSGASLHLANNVSIAETIFLNGFGPGNTGALRSVSGDNLVTGNVIVGWAGGSVTASDTAILVDLASQVTISGVISGSRGITKLGGGTLVLNGSNTYSGGISVSDGALQGNSNSLIGNIVNNAEVTFQQNWNGTYAGVMSGSGRLIKTGTGTLTLQGANTYSGGTLVSDGALAGTTASLQGDITNNANVIFDQATLGAYTGVMSGSGHLTKTGSGTVTLEGANTYSGGTLVSDGSLAGTTTSLQGDITNNANVTFDQATHGTYAGVMSGSGQLTKTGSGTVVLEGANTYSGGTIVSDGSLVGTTTSLQGDIINNANVTFDQATLGTFADSISGNGNLIKLGAGDLIFSGAHTYTGGTAIERGLLAVNSSILGPTTVGNLGKLGGNGVIVGDVTNHGTISAGNSIGTLAIHGNYTHTSGSVMQVEINAGGTTPGVNNDLLQVQSATLQGGMVQVATEGGNYDVGSTYRFLSSETSIQGEFSGISVNLSGFRATLGYDFSGGLHWAYFVLNRSHPDFLEFATSENQQAAAAYLETIAPLATDDLNSVFAEWSSLENDLAAMQSSIDMIGSQIGPTMAMVELQNTTLVMQHLAGRLRSFDSFTATSGYGGFDSTFGNDDVPIALARFDSPKDCAPVEFASRKTDIDWHGWGSGYGLGGSASSNGNAAGLNYGMGGNLMGIERQFDTHGRVGLYGGYQGTRLRLNSPNQTGRIDGGIFGSYFRNEGDLCYFSAINGFQFNSYDTQRSLQFHGVDREALGSSSGWQGFGYLEQGASFHGSRIAFQPFVAIQYVYLRHNTNMESGADSLNLIVHGIDAHSLRNLIGGRWQLHHGIVSARVLPEFRALWLHEYLDTNAVVTNAFSPIPGGGFAVQGLDLGRDWAIVGGGLRFRLRRGWTAYFNYDSQCNNQQVFHFGSGGIQSSW